MKNFFIFSLFVLFITLSFQRYIGFISRQNNSRFKYLNEKAIKNNPRIQKIRKSGLVYNKESNKYRYSKHSYQANTNSSTKHHYNRGPDGKYLYFGRIKNRYQRNKKLNMTNTKNIIKKH